METPSCLRSGSILTVEGRARGRPGIHQEVRKADLKWTPSRKQEGASGKGCGLGGARAEKLGLGTGDWGWREWNSDRLLPAGSYLPATG